MTTVLWKAAVVISLLVVAAFLGLVWVASTYWDVAQRPTVIVGGMSIVVALLAVLGAYRQMEAATRSAAAAQRSNALMSIQTIELEWIRAPLNFAYPLGRTRRVTRVMNEARTSALGDVREPARRRRWIQRSLDLWSPENRLAYELGLRLERLGVSCFFGVVSSAWALAYFGSALAEDWALAKAATRARRPPLVGIRRCKSRRGGQPGR